MTKTFVLQKKRKNEFFFSKSRENLSLRVFSHLQLFFPKLAVTMIYPVHSQTKSCAYAFTCYCEFLKVSPKVKKSFNDSGGGDGNVKFEGGCGNDAG